MNFKAELLAKVLAGKKTQTRRPVKAGECAKDVWEHYLKVDHPLFTQEVGSILRVDDARGRTRYEFGKQYAVCPGRGKKGQGVVRLIDIRFEDVRNISITDVCAEGFEYPGEFLKVWCGFYDKKARWEFDPQRMDYWINSGKRRELVGWDTVLEIINARPANLYRAWALTFELVR